MIAWSHVRLLNPPMCLVVYAAEKTMLFTLQGPGCSAQGYCIVSGSWELCELESCTVTNVDCSTCWKWLKLVGQGKKWSQEKLLVTTDTPKQQLTARYSVTLLAAMRRRDEKMEAGGQPLPEVFKPLWSPIPLPVTSDTVSGMRRLACKTIDGHRFGQAKPVLSQWTALCYDQK